MTATNIFYNFVGFRYSPLPCVVRRRNAEVTDAGDSTHNSDMDSMIQHHNCWT